MVIIPTCAQKSQVARAVMTTTNEILLYTRESFMLLYLFIYNQLENIFIFLDLSQYQDVCFFAKIACSSCLRKILCLHPLRNNQDYANDAYQYSAIIPGRARSQGGPCEQVRVRCRTVLCFRVLELELFYFIVLTFKVSLKEKVGGFGKVKVLISCYQASLGLSDTSLVSSGAPKLFYTPGQ